MHISYVWLLSYEIQCFFSVWANCYDISVASLFILYMDSMRDFLELQVELRLR